MTDFLFFHKNLTSLYRDLNDISQKLVFYFNIDPHSLIGDKHAFISHFQLLDGENRKKNIL